MAAVAQGVAVRTAAAAHQHRGRLPQPQLVGHTARAQVGSITEPAMAAAAATAQLVHSGWKLKRLRAGGGGMGLRHLSSNLPVGPDPSLRQPSDPAAPQPSRRAAGETIEHNAAPVLDALLTWAALA
jgi:hypothetical protein